MDRPGYPLFKIYAALLGKQVQRQIVTGQCSDKRMAGAMAQKESTRRAGKGSQRAVSSSER